MEDGGGVGHVVDDWEDLFSALQDIFVQKHLQVQIICGVPWKHDNAEKGQYLLETTTSDPDLMSHVQRSIMVDLQFGKTRKISKYASEEGMAMFKHFIVQKHSRCVIKPKEGKGRSTPEVSPQNDQLSTAGMVTQEDLHCMEQCLQDFLHLELQAQAVQTGSIAPSNVGSHGKPPSSIGLEEEQAFQLDPDVGPILQGLEKLKPEQCQHAVKQIQMKLLFHCNASYVP